MEFLLPVAQGPIGEELVLTVNAKELHAFLEVGKDFSNWIKDRIGKYNFIENQDFIVFAKFGENPQGGRPATEYHLTLDMAKELAMVQSNAKGQQARRYFIRCEKRLKDSTGLIKSIVKNEVTQAITGAITVAMEEIVSKMVEKQVAVTVEAQLKDDPRIAVEAMVSARQILDEEKVPSKKRRGLVVSTSHSLLDYCIQHGLTPKRCARTRTWLFPVCIKPAWLKAAGRRLIDDHHAAIYGQLKLDLVPMPDVKKGEVYQ
ncbi:MAG: antA/AntB antirepressor family protein [Magnetococcales bacterium]|nr:antA/AntB antirepressor family protein [Magnetococcales bacterium]